MRKNTWGTPHGCQPTRPATRQPALGGTPIPSLEDLGFEAFETHPSSAFPLPGVLPRP